MQKIKFLFLAVVVLIISLFSSCGNKANDNTKTGNGKMETWAEDVKCITMFKEDTLKDEDQLWEAYDQKVEKEKMITEILEAVKSGKQKAYDVLLNEDSVIPTAVIKAKLDRVDTLMVEDIHNPGTFKTVIQPYQINASDIKQIAFREKWYFDPEKFRMEKKVRGIVLIKYSVDEHGNIRGNEPLFWVKTNE